VTREEIFARDGYRCVYCGTVQPAEALSVDHVHPRVKGGDRSPGNLVTACIPCNSRKGARTIARFLADEPEALAHFEALAVHAWPRHRRTLRELVDAELTGGDAV
jgi:5-methylcytosine-specific restriction endonuclease McrA